MRFRGVETTWQACTAKGQCPAVKTKERHPPHSENKKLWGGRGGQKGLFFKTSDCWTAGHLPVYGCGAEHEWSMRRMGLQGGRGQGGEEEAEEEKERRRSRRWWWTDGRGLEVDGGQLAAGRLRELCHHTGQGPVLSLQPLLNLA